MSAQELPRKVRRASLRFLNYQRRWFSDPSPMRLAVKARRVGGSTMLAYDAACKGIGYNYFTGRIEAERGGNINIISASKKQAQDILRNATIHVRSMDALPLDIDQAVSLARKHNLPLTVDVLTAICDEIAQRKPSAGHIIIPKKRAAALHNAASLIDGDPTSNVVRLSNGATMVAYSSNPNTIRGNEGHVFFDEFGAAPHDKEIWTAGALLAAKSLGFPEGFTVSVIGTPEGDDRLFYRFAMTEEGRAFSRHKIDLQTAIQDGFPITVEEARAAVGGLEDMYLQEFCCVFLSAASRYIPVELLDAAIYDERELNQALAGSRSATCGLDVAESDRVGADPCALVRNYRIGPVPQSQVYWMAPHIQRGTGVSFQTQEEWVRAELEGRRNAHGYMLEQPACHRAAVDASGIGRDMAKRLVQRFGDRVLAVDFTPANKEIMATRCKRFFEARPIKQRIPDDIALRRGLLNLHRIVTRDSARTRFTMERDGKGHGDEAWALMLAQHASEMLGGEYIPQKGFLGRG